MRSSYRALDAFIYQRHTGRVLSRREFEEDIMYRVRSEISRYRLIEPSDTVLLAVSGGKDSFVLVDTIARIHDTSRLLAVTIIEGIESLGRTVEVEKIGGILKSYGIDYLVYSFKEYYGLSLDEIMERVLRLGVRESACTYCGVLRRRLLNSIAREHGVDKVATAHNLDDEAQTIVMNLLRGDTTRLPRLHPRAPILSKQFIPRIKPLRKIYEYETTAYAYMKKYGFQHSRCPYVDLKPSLRSYVRRLLYSLESVHPGFSLRLLENCDKLLEDRLWSLEKLPELPSCGICGEPTSYGREVCKVCELLIKIGVIERK